VEDSQTSLSRRLAAEGVGTCLLVAAIVGSGIMAERLAGDSAGLALLCNALATGAALLALILTFGPISGAQFNPVVSLASASRGELAWRDVPGYISVQALGGVLGVALAEAMFGEPVFALSRHAREGWPQVLSECVATFGLLGVIWGCSRRRRSATPFAVSAYIVAAYWFTASTSFANPAVTVARAMTDTFTGIRPANVPAFIAAQLVGAALATAFFRWLIPRRAAEGSVHGGQRLGLEVETQKLDSGAANVLER
jgi:glycerol uptake facilitator-like aquaporin